MNELTSKFQNKIFLMDNVRFHKNDDINTIMKDTNNTTLYIPPYSPEFNPIEEVFSLFKSVLRRKIIDISGYLKLDDHIKGFLNTAKNFACYYAHAFD